MSEAPPPEQPDPDGQEPRLANVRFVNDLLDTEIAQRNARKDAQESTARWIILTAGAIITLLVSLADGAGVFSDDASVTIRLSFALTIVAGGAAVIAAIGTLRPRSYDRIGGEALDTFKNPAFLDQREHEVTGTIVATRIDIAKTMDANHEIKARWLKMSFLMLMLAFVVLAAQGVALALDPPPRDTARAGDAAGENTPDDRPNVDLPDVDAPDVNPPDVNPPDVNLPDDNSPDADPPTATNESDDGGGAHEQDSEASPDAPVASGPIPNVTKSRVLPRTP